MNINEIEHAIACNEMNAAQVFTQMKQHIQRQAKIQERNVSMAQIIDSLVTEYCDRDGEEDYPVEAEHQSCPAIKKAMLFVDSVCN